MFGTQRDFDNRLMEYRNSLTGIKHLYRLKTPSAYASRPQSNEPIALHVTTSGGIAYDSVRCWMNVDGEESTFELVPGESVWNPLEWRYIRHWVGQIPPQRSGAIVRYKIGGRVVGADRWVFADNADALRRTFVLETSTLLEFEAFLAAHEAYFPPDFSLPVFLDNHDMTRILYKEEGDR